MSRVIDHSTAGVSIGAALKAGGVAGVVRYAAAGRGDVNITPHEIADLRNHGLAIGIVNEHSAGYLLGGREIGKQRAHEAQQISVACGLPEGVVYMAGDDDLTLGGPTYPGSAGSRQMQKVGAALEGAGEAIGRGNVGFYGGYFAIDWVVHNVPWIKYIWQTPGWSQRLVHPTADLYQGSQVSRQPVFSTINGVQCDVNEIRSSDWGQRTNRPQNHNPSGHFNADLSLLANNGSWQLKGTPSHDVHFGDSEALYTLAVGVFVGGKRHGEWIKKPMPKNWVPSGGW